VGQDRSFGARHLPVSFFKDASATPNEEENWAWLMLAMLMPLAPGATIPKQVLDGLSSQTEPCELVTHCSAIKDPARVHEIANRNYLKQFARGKYTGLMDADHVMTDPRTIEILIV
jgi:hypothetical protein